MASPSQTTVTAHITSQTLPCALWVQEHATAARRRTAAANEFLLTKVPQLNVTLKMAHSPDGYLGSHRALSAPGPVEEPVASEAPDFMPAWDEHKDAVCHNTNAHALFKNFVLEKLPF